MRRGLAVLLAVALSGCGSAKDEDAAAIRQLMSSTWDRPDSHLEIGPIVTQADVAIVGWTQGALGGRAYLRRGPQGWRIMLCGGAGLRTPAGLRSLGLSEATATDLAARVRHAEVAIEPTRLRRMDAFQGLVRMNDPARSPPLHRPHS